MSGRLSSYSSLIYSATAAGLILFSIGRIVATYGLTAEGFDEPCHVAAGMELLDKGMYTLDPVHPTLARIAIALPLYVAGLRYPALPPSDPGSRNYNVVGNHILYDHGDWMRNLRLARMGVLPFFVLGAVLVYAWGRRAGSDRAALIAVFLYCTTPSILAFSSIAYTDIVAASTQLGAMFVFSLWLENPDRKRTWWLGVALGLACLAKLTGVLFLPAAAVAIVLAWVAVKRTNPLPGGMTLVQQFAVIMAMIALIVWGGYGFAMHHFDEAVGIDRSSMPSFKSFPAPVGAMARSLILKNPRVPAAELLNGAAKAWVLNKTASSSYLFGRIKVGGWWYFYMVGLGVKLPLPLLLLFGTSILVFLLAKPDVAVILSFGRPGWRTVDYGSSQLSGRHSSRDGSHTAHRDYGSLGLRCLAQTSRMAKSSRRSGHHSSSVAGS